MLYRKAFRDKTNPHQGMKPGGGFLRKVDGVTVGQLTLQALFILSELHLLMQLILFADF